VCGAHRHAPGPFIWNSGESRGGKRSVDEAHRKERKEQAGRTWNKTFSPAQAKQYSCLPQELMEVRMKCPPRMFPPPVAKSTQVETVDEKPSEKRPKSRPAKTSTPASMTCRGCKVCRARARTEVVCTCGSGESALNQENSRWGIARVAVYRPAWCRVRRPRPAPAQKSGCVGH